MIDPQTFAHVMGAFADRIGRALAPATASLYFDTLSPVLTTEQFIAGARIVFRAHQFNTWPAPQQFIDAATPTGDARLSAAEAFERVLSAATTPRLERAEREMRIAEVGDVAIRAYRAAGGWRTFCGILDDEVKWARRDFIDAYERLCSDEAKRATAQAALASAGSDEVVELQDPAAAIRLLIGTVAEVKAMQPPKPKAITKGRDPVDFKARAAGGDA